VWSRLHTVMQGLYEHCFCIVSLIDGWALVWQAIPTRGIRCLQQVACELTLVTHNTFFFALISALRRAAGLTRAPQGGTMVAVTHHLRPCAPVGAWLCGCVSVSVFVVGHSDVSILTLLGRSTIPARDHAKIHAHNVAMTFALRSITSDTPRPTVTTNGELHLRPAHSAARHVTAARAAGNAQRLSRERSAAAVAVVARHSTPTRDLLPRVSNNDTGPHPTVAALALHSLINNHPTSNAERAKQSRESPASRVSWRCVSSQDSAHQHGSYTPKQRSSQRHTTLGTKQRSPTTTSSRQGKRECGESRWASRGRLATVHRGRPAAARGCRGLANSCWWAAVHGQPY
jgi:hypothetical protein